MGGGAALVGCGDDEIGSQTAEPVAEASEPDDGPDDGAVCAAAVLEVTQQHLSDSAA